MNDLEIYIVRAFTKDGKGGNGAGVVIPKNGIEFNHNLTFNISGMTLNKAAKQAIAAKLNLSETVFPSKSDKADIRLEYFTPAGEVPVCGHATIAFFTALRDTDSPAEKRFYTIETGTGILNITLDGQKTYMEQNRPEFSEVIPTEELSGCFEGLEFAEKCSSSRNDEPVESDNPGRTNKTDKSDGTNKADNPLLNMVPQIVSTGLRDILLPVKNTETLARLKPDFIKISELSRKYGCIGIHAFAIPDGGASEELCAVCRNFAPLYGIDEESATGTSNCALACYLFRNGIRLKEYRFEQGYNLGMISEITVRLETTGDTITGVYVGGEGAIIGRMNYQDTGQMSKLPEE